MSADAIKRIEAARQAAIVSRIESEKTCEYFRKEAIRHQKSMERLPLYFFTALGLILIFGYLL